MVRGVDPRDRMHMKDLKIVNSASTDFKHAQQNYYLGKAYVFLFF